MEPGEKRKDEKDVRRSRSRSRSRERFRRDKGNEVERRQGSLDNAPRKGTIHMIAGGPTSEDSGRARKRYARDHSRQERGGSVLAIEQEQVISFGMSDLQHVAGPQNDPMVIRADITNFTVHKVLIDNDSFVDVIFMDVLRKMGLEGTRMHPTSTSLVGFGGSEVNPVGMVDLPVSLGEEPARKTVMVKFLVVDAPFAYNEILGRPALNMFQAIVSTFHLKMKFPTKHGVGEVVCDQKEARECYNVSLKKRGAQQSSKMARNYEEVEVPDVATQVPSKKRREEARIEPIEEHKVIELVPGNPDRTTKVGSRVTFTGEAMIINFLRKNVDVFAWSSEGFQGIDPGVIVHRLNVDHEARPVK